MAAAWLAQPQLARLPLWLLAGIMIGLVVIALRPRLFLLAFVILLAVAVLRPRNRGGNPRARR